MPQMLKKLPCDVFNLVHVCVPVEHKGRPATDMVQIIFYLESDYYPEIQGQGFTILTNL